MSIETATMEWNDSLSVAVPEIDADHQILIELITQIGGDVGRQETITVIGTVLAALSDYTEYHFAREERMLEAVGYPHLAAHRQHHEDLKAQVAEYLHRFTAAPAQVDLAELRLFLKRWLFEHIVKDDMPYAAYCADNPKARDAVVSVGLDFFFDPPAEVVEG